MISIDKELMFAFLLIWSGPLKSSQTKQLMDKDFLLLCFNAPEEKVAVIFFFCLF